MSPRIGYDSVLAKARVLVLGGSSSIGFCVAEHALSLGAIVTISSSRQAKLNTALERLKDRGAGFRGLSGRAGVRFV